MQETLQRLFRFKTWADDELLDALARIDGSSPVLEPALKALSHTHIVDRIFAAHLRREAHPHASANARELPTLQALSADIRSSDREYLDYVPRLDRRQLREPIDFRFTDGAAGRMTREEMLMHVITHGVGHRGQVSALLLLNGMAPARDGFTTYLHESEAAARRRAA